MARPRQITRETLAPLIRARGPVSATELAALAHADRTTIVRGLRAFGDDLVTLGATRSTRYLLRRNIRSIGNCWPIYRIGPEGRPSEWAEIEALHDNQWRVRWVGTAPAWEEHFVTERGLWEGFPFFLGDARPQGFLGRTIASRISSLLQLPGTLKDWSDEHILIYLQAAGEDLPGNLVVGEDCLRRALGRLLDSAENRLIDEGDVSSIYPARALDVANELPGSSAGGEQPKFLAHLRGAGNEVRPVLVKFSADTGHPVGARWGDLLLCECIVHQVLAGAGAALSGTRLLTAGDRRFLEVPRFDRTASGGRLGVVSLEALSASAIGSLFDRDWSAAASALRGRELIDDSSVILIRRLQAFGELIGNTDMHPGNLSFFLGDTLPLRLTPAYDMLPMLWAPGAQGELIERRFTPLPPLPSMTADWRIAAQWAEDFWQRTVDHPLLSRDFASIAAGALEKVRNLRRLVG